MSFDAFTAATEWVREAHRMRVTPTYHNAGEWQCSCGAETGPGVLLTYAQAKANADRHLRAQVKRRMAQKLW